MQSILHEWFVEVEHVITVECNSIETWLGRWKPEERGWHGIINLRHHEQLPNSS